MGRSACLLNDASVRIYVSLIMRPWNKLACISTAPWHLGTTSTSRMLERFHWCVFMNVCTPAVASPLLVVQFAETTVRLRIISISLPEGRGIPVSVDFSGPLPVIL